MTTKDEIKNRISMALKDPILQQGFEIICRGNDELESENRRIAGECHRLVDTLEQKQKENAELKKRNGELAGQKASLERWFGEAKAIMKDMLSILPKENIEGIYEITEEAEQFLRETDIDNDIKKVNEGLKVGKQKWHKVADGDLPNNCRYV